MFELTRFIAIVSFFWSMNKPHTYDWRRRIAYQRWRPPSQHLPSTHRRLDSSSKGLHTHRCEDMHTVVVPIL